MHHTGGFCQPDTACGSNVGYRQGYASSAGSGWALSVSAGYRLDRLRFELTARQHSGSMNRGTHSKARHDAYGIASHSIVSMSSAGSLRTQTMALGLYYDVTAGSATSYLGAGIGLTRAAVTGSYLESVFSCSTELTCAGIRSMSHNQIAFDLHGWGISRHLYGGVDYDLGEPFLIGMKLAYHFFADVGDSARKGSAPQMRPLDASVGGVNRFSFSVGVKYALGRK